MSIRLRIERRRLTRLKRKLTKEYLDLTEATEKQHKNTAICCKYCTIDSKIDEEIAKQTIMDKRLEQARVDLGFLSADIKQIAEDQRHASKRSS